MGLRDITPAMKGPMKNRMETEIEATLSTAGSNVGPCLVSL